MRSERTDQALLAEIRECTSLIQAYLDGRSTAEFSNDLMCQDATAFRLLMIGEAAHRLSDAIKARLPDVDWRGMISLRHRLAHDYPSTETLVLWTIATQDVPALAAALERL